MKKVAIVAFSAPPYSAGGVASAHFNLYRGLRHKGIRAKLFTFGDTKNFGKSSIVRNGAPQWFTNLVRRICKYAFWVLAPGKEAYQVADILASQWGARRMSKAIAKFSADAVVLSDHGAPGLALRKPKGAKLVLVSHHNPARFVAHPQVSRYSKLDAKIAVWLEQKAVRKADVVVCPSNYMVRWFRKTYVFSGPIKVIPNLLDERSIHKITPSKLRKKLNLRGKDSLIFIPSAGSWLKGAGDLNKILEHIKSPKTRTAFYLPGSIPANLPAGVLTYIPGQIPYQTHIANLKTCDFGISPSIMENYSMALLEAVSCGVPMIAYDTGGNSEIVSNGKNGFLVKEGNANALIKRAMPLLKPQKRKKIRASSVKFSRATLSPNYALNAYAELLT